MLNFCLKKFLTYDDINTHSKDTIDDDNINADIGSK